MNDKIEQLRLELNYEVTHGSSLNLVTGTGSKLNRLIHWETQKKTTCCFTGPRPQKFRFKFNENHPECILIKKRIRERILEVLCDGYTIFVCGGALGVDTWAAYEVLELKKMNPMIKLEIAVPCRGQSNRWTAEQKKRGKYIFENADNVYYTSDTPYYKGCMYVRNMHMVDRSSLVIAVDADTGGTGQTLRYAKGKEVRILYV